MAPPGVLLGPAGALGPALVGSAEGAAPVASAVGAAEVAGASGRLEPASEPQADSSRAAAAVPARRAEVVHEVRMEPLHVTSVRPR
ncbi:MAG: hypothetical protein AVDCRST_MAG48-3628 [uncultured Friedmanniella sp.]|uniref:Uncharacterized protein n=1 Tax=uncultured Friedmanniella sp. TaxID=335381 RepID=A0A6J4LST8_9ACTN|nr:MAG: hypothetical protein AVDCRST_MAG48-3628 [uncultured Friedmanniella sp.]